MRLLVLGLLVLSILWLGRKIVVVLRSFAARSEPGGYGFAACSEPGEEELPEKPAPRPAPVRVPSMFGSLEVEVLCPA